MCLCHAGFIEVSLPKGTHLRTTISQQQDTSSLILYAEPAPKKT